MTVLLKNSEGYHAFRDRKRQNHFGVLLLLKIKYSVISFCQKKELRFQGTYNRPQNFLEIFKLLDRIFCKIKTFSERRNREYTLLLQCSPVLEKNGGPQKVAFHQAYIWILKTEKLQTAYGAAVCLKYKCVNFFVK